MSRKERTKWACEVVADLNPVIEREGIDGVIVIGGELYANPLVRVADDIPLHAPLFTPWQTHDDVAGVGYGMGWCNTESNRPDNLDELDESILGPAQGGE